MCGGDGSFCTDDGNDSNWHCVSEFRKVNDEIACSIRRMWVACVSRAIGFAAVTPCDLATATISSSTSRFLVVARNVSAETAMVVPRDSVAGISLVGCSSISLAQEVRLANSLTGWGA